LDGADVGSGCVDVTGLETDGLGGALGAVDLGFRAGLVSFGAGESGLLPVSPARYHRCLATFMKPRALHWASGAESQVLGGTYASSEGDG
nr:hypothetical protein [Tanacetum cinerariifolium]